MDSLSSMAGVGDSISPGDVQALALYLVGTYSFCIRRYSFVFTVLYYFPGGGSMQIFFYILLERERNPSYQNRHNPLGGTNT